MAKFEIYIDDDMEYRWRFKADNGEIMADSGEGYNKKRDCKKAIKTLKKEVPDAEIE